MNCLIIDSDLRPDDTSEVKKILTRAGIGFIECDQSEIAYHGDADFMIVLGGDGSVLAVSHQALKADIPILCINHGTLGYLSRLECGEAEKLIALKDGFQTESRMTLSASLIRDGAVIEEFSALNEITATKGGVSSLIGIELCCNGRSVGTYRADGIIVSTPTGSTAYNLSAGGPVIDTALEALTVCPVCSHSLSGQRALVFAPSSVIELLPNVRRDRRAFLTADGRDSCEIKNGDIVRIVKNEKYQRFVKLGESEFYDILKNKLLI